MIKFDEFIIIHYFVKKEMRLQVLGESDDNWSHIFINYVNFGSNIQITGELKKFTL